MTEQLQIINKYYDDHTLRDILLRHSRAVADKALEIVRNHPELHADERFVEEAAMLHDIGIVKLHLFSAYYNRKVAFAYLRALCLWYYNALTSAAPVRSE